MDFRTVLSRRFPIHEDPSNLARCKSTSSIGSGCDELLPLSSSQSHSQQSINNNNTNNNNQLDQSLQHHQIAWCPATEFLHREERQRSYSFALRKFGAAASGEGFQAVFEELKQHLEAHIEQAKHLVETSCAGNGNGQGGLPEEIEETLRVAIGRTQLLLNNRMKQFQDHLKAHLKPVSRQKPTKLDDLHGLWALIEMQLEDIQCCFDSVEQCRLNNWKSIDEKGGEAANVEATGENGNGQEEK